MIHYMDGGPFETVRIANGSSCVVLAYDDEIKAFIYSYPGRNVPIGFLAGRLDACGFNPPPPIPAAARKPQIGEVWIMQTAPSKKHVARLIIRPSSTGYDTFTPDMCLDWYSCDWVLRPATPAESEPFRPILEGLKRSLGES